MTVQFDDLFLNLSLQGAEARRLFLARSIFDHFGGVVGYGPLKGFQLDQASSWNAADLGSKMFGLYEQEILEMLKVRPGGKSILVNLGAADGYYGVGLVKAGLYSKAICYEASEAGREVIAKTAALNKVTGLVEIEGEATPDFPDQLMKGGIDPSQCLVLCDIEGGEFDVLSAGCLAKLSRSVMIIELHEFMVQDGIAKAEALIGRLKQNFSVSFATTGARDLSPYPELENVNDTDRWLICSEGRGKRMTWALCMPK